MKFFLLCLINTITAVEQVHLAIGGTESQDIVVSWVSRNDTQSIVSYGLRSDQLSSIATAPSPKQYHFNSYTSGFIHHVLLSNLLPDTTYYYTCGCYDHRSIRSFRSPVQRGSTKPLTFAIVGDVGQTNYSRETLNYVARSPNLTAILHVGDLAYADFVQPRWDSWGRMVDSLASKIPWMVAPGNHEIEPTHSLKPFVAYQARFRMPHRESRATAGNLYYSFDVGMVHVIVLTPYSMYHHESAQYKWLKQDLKRMDRNVTPWVIVMMHAPWYNSNTAHQSLMEPQWLMKKSMESILYRYHVDLVLSGHVHAYERSHPVFKGKLNPAAPRYIVIGDAGNREGLAKKYIDPQPHWSAFRRGRYGYGILKVSNATHALFEWHEDEETANHIPDAFWLVKSKTAAIFDFNGS